MLCGKNGGDKDVVGRMEGIWMFWLRMEGTDMWGECRGYGCCGENGGDMDVLVENGGDRYVGRV